MPVPCSHLLLVAEHDDPVDHVVESNAQLGLALLQSTRSLLDYVLESHGGFGAFGEQFVKGDRVAPEGFDSATHCSDLVVALDGYWGEASACGDVEHRAIQPGKAANDIAPDIEPHDQNRGDKAEPDQNRDCLSAESLHLYGASNCIPDIPLGRADQVVGSRRQPG